MKKINVVLLFLLFSVISVSIKADNESSDKPWVAVHDFTVSNVLQKNGITGWNVAERIENDIVQTGEYRIVTRSKIDKVMKEKNLKSSENMDASEFGKLVGADYIITGQVIARDNKISVIAKLVDISKDTGEVEKSFDVSAIGTNTSDLISKLPELYDKLAAKLTMTPGECLDDGLHLMAEGDYYKAYESFKEAKALAPVEKIKALQNNKTIKPVETEEVKKLKSPGNILDFGISQMNQGNDEVAQAAFNKFTKITPFKEITKVFEIGKMQRLAVYLSDKQKQGVRKKIEQAELFLNNSNNDKDMTAYELCDEISVNLKDVLDNQNIKLSADEKNTIMKLTQKLDKLKLSLLPEDGRPNMKAAIFVRDNGEKPNAGELNTFSDMLSARLTDKGFSVMDWKNIIQKFSESNYPDDQIFKDVRSLMAVATNTESNDSFTATVSNSKERVDDSVTAMTSEGGVANSSILRIGQMLGADYIIFASMGKIGHEKRSFKGKGTVYKTDNSVDIFSMPLTVRVLDGNDGKSLYGDALNAYDRIYQNENIDIRKNNIADTLIDTGTKELADNIGTKLDSIQSAKLKTQSVSFSVSCNGIEGVTVELDGTAIGSAPGKFKAAPGIHQMRLSRQYFNPWEKTVNIYEGETLNITLEFSTEGQAQFKDLAAFKQAQDLEKLKTVAAVDIAREQSKADADAKEKISSGQEEFYKNSYIRSDGFAQQLEKIIHGSGWF